MYVCSTANAQFITSGDSKSVDDGSNTVNTEKTYFSTAKGDTRFTYNFYYGMPDVEGANDGKFALGFEYLWGYYIADNAFVQAGLGWHTGFARFKEDSRNTITDNFTVINIPMAIGYNIPLGGKCSLDAYTGPRLNYTIAGKIEVNDDGDRYKIKYKDIDDLDRFYVDWNVGAAIMFGSFGITAEYRAALNDDFADFTHIGIRLVY